MKKIVNGLLEQCEENMGHMPKLTLMPTMNYYFIALSHTLYSQYKEMLFFEYQYNAGHMFCFILKL
jgi:hypothetical protein